MSLGLLKYCSDNDDDSGFIITGKSCTIIRDDVTAFNLDEGKQLILWDNRKEKALWIDRFDVRMMLSSYSLIKKVCNDGVEDEDEGNVDLQYERYQALLDANEEDLLPKNDIEIATKSQINYTYPSEYQNTTKYNDDDDKLELPSFVLYPKDLLIPKSRKQYHIILHTARSTRESNQLEILLKVKQAANPAFDFLNYDSDLFAFYQYLKQCSEEKFWKIFLQQETTTTENKEEPETELEVEDTNEVTKVDAPKTNENALRLLGLSYYDSDNDDDTDNICVAHNTTINTINNSLHDTDIFRNDNDTINDILLNMIQIIENNNNNCNSYNINNNNNNNLIMTTTTTAQPHYEFSTDNNHNKNNHDIINHFNTNFIDSNIYSMTNNNASEFVITEVYDVLNDIITKIMLLDDENQQNFPLDSTAISTGTDDTMTTIADNCNTQSELCTNIDVVTINSNEEIIIPVLDNSLGHSSLFDLLTIYSDDSDSDSDSSSISVNNNTLIEKMKKVNTINNISNTITDISTVPITTTNTTTTTKATTSLLNLMLSYCNDDGMMNATVETYDDDSTLATTFTTTKRSDKDNNNNNSNNNSNNNNTPTTAIDPINNSLNHKEDEKIFSTSTDYTTTATVTTNIPKSEFSTTTTTTTTTFPIIPTITTITGLIGLLNTTIANLCDSNSDSNSITTGDIPHQILPNMEECYTMITVIIDKITKGICICDDIEEESLTDSHYSFLQPQSSLYSFYQKLLAVAESVVPQLMLQKSDVVEVTTAIPLDDPPPTTTHTTTTHINSPTTTTIPNTAAPTICTSNSVTNLVDVPTANASTDGDGTVTTSTTIIAATNNSSTVTNKSSLIKFSLPSLTKETTSTSSYRDKKSTPHPNIVAVLPVETSPETVLEPDSEEMLYITSYKSIASLQSTTTTTATTTSCTQSDNSNNKNAIIINKGSIITNNPITSNNTSTTIPHNNNNNNNNNNYSNNNNNDSEDEVEDEFEEDVEMNKFWMTTSRTSKEVTAADLLERQVPEGSNTITSMVTTDIATSKVKNEMLLEEKRAERLRRAKLLRGHFCVKGNLADSIVVNANAISISTSKSGTSVEEANSSSSSSNGSSSSHIVAAHNLISSNNITGKKEDNTKEDIESFTTIDNSYPKKTSLSGSNVSTINQFTGSLDLSIPSTLTMTPTVSVILERDSHLEKLSKRSRASRSMSRSRERNTNSHYETKKKKKKYSRSYSRSRSRRRRREDTDSHHHSRHRTNKSHNKHRYRDSENSHRSNSGSDSSDDREKYPKRKRSKEREQKQTSSYSSSSHRHNKRSESRDRKRSRSRSRSNRDRDRDRDKDRRDREKDGEERKKGGKDSKHHDHHHRREEEGDKGNNHNSQSSHSKKEKHSDSNENMNLRQSNITSRNPLQNDNENLPKQRITSYTTTTTTTTTRSNGDRDISKAVAATTDSTSLQEKIRLALSMLK